MGFPHLSRRDEGELHASPSPYHQNTNRLFGKRLVALYGYLSGLPSSRYAHARLVTKIKESNPCGAVACAFGHAVVSGKFPDIKARADIVYEDGVACGSWRDGRGSISFEPIGRDAIRRRLIQLLSSIPADARSAEYTDDYGAVSTRFGLSASADAYFGPGAWETLFDEDAYGYAQSEPSKAVVLKRIATVAKECYGVDVRK